MERNQLIGLVVMLVFITAYFTWFAPEPPAPVEQDTTEQTQPQDTEESKTPTAETEPEQLTDSAKNKLNEMKYGLFSAAVNGTEELVELENTDLKISLNSKGGVIQDITLKDHKDYLGNPLVLSSKEHADFHLYVEHLGKQIDLNEFYYSINRSSNADTTLTSFTLSLDDNRWIKYTYSLPPSGFEIGFDVETEGLKDIVGNKIQYAWNLKFNRLEMDLSDARSRSTVRYSTINEDVDFLSRRSSGLEEETIADPVKWMAFKQKFFTSGIIAGSSFDNGFISSNVSENDTTSAKSGVIRGQIPYEKFIAGNLSFKYFFGPNDFEVLREVAPEFEENIDYGYSLLTPINKHFIRHIFNFVESFVPNYVIVIMMIMV